ncbi:MAG: hypothetical protein JWQ57_663 [Mucilaginibacter sp.]|nr:hypothetical protein [Mucilaginibacter sp.]
MGSKTFSILSYKNVEEIKSIVKLIGDCLLTETSHDYSNRAGKTITEASKLSSTNYNLKAINNPAIALTEVVLAANRNYVKVVDPYIKEAEIKFPFVKTFDDLTELMKEKNWEQFSDFWHHKDEKKYNTLKSILYVITKLRENYSLVQIHDYELMNHWAINADVTKYSENPIGRIPNVAVATFQHLRMVFGANTVKPDQRVKEVLGYEFSTPKLSDINAVLAVEQIAKICNLMVLEVDQIFVNYGSGYYNRTNTKITPKDIAKRLKERNIDSETIIYATGLTSYQISKI